MKGKISTLLKEASQLFELNSENPFKVKAFLNASNVVKTSSLGLDELIEQAEQKKIKGLGPQTLIAIKEIVAQGFYKEAEDLKAQFKPSYLELLKIKGLGVKTLRTLNQELNVESIQDLEKLCVESKLASVKGFGEKLQAKFLDAINLHKTYAGKLRLDQASIFVDELKKEIPSLLPTGQLKENCEVIDNLELICKEEFKTSTLKNCELTQESPNRFSGKGLSAINLSIEIVKDEKDYQNRTKPSFEDNLSESDLKGILHVHTTYSDGADSLRSICTAVKEKGFDYIGISDHSKTAVYARGLHANIIKKQHLEIEILNNELAPFRIFKGIESDILNDGALDYPEEVLQQFDFIIASIHSSFSISREEMTKRMLKALENKYTTILAHPTGRLILDREAYEVDLEKIIDRAGELGKSIELNCNPKRLELDWRFHKKAQELKIQVPISPDAHSIQNIDYIKWGVKIANKGGLKKENVLNCKTLKEIENYFKS